MVGQKVWVSRNYAYPLKSAHSVIRVRQPEALAPVSSDACSAFRIPWRKNFIQLVRISYLFCEHLSFTQNISLTQS